MKKRNIGDVIMARTGIDSLGRYFWYEEPPGFTGDYPPPGATVYGTFATRAECNESQRLVLLGPQCEVVEGGDWDPAFDTMQ